MKELRKLQVRLCQLQEWVKEKGLRVIIIFEGRDTAGKGGTIKALVERVSPRIFRVVALPAPSDREKSQLFAQRYFAHFPSAGEIVIFDRSWYNRAGVEYVMGLISKEQHERFLVTCPDIELVVDNEIILLKIWLEVGQQEQDKRFAARITIHSGSGSSVQWTCNPTRDGTTTLARATECLKQPTQNTHRGTLCVPTTNDVRDSIASLIFYQVFLTKKSNKTKFGYPRDQRKTNTTTKRRCAGENSWPHAIRSDAVREAAYSRINWGRFFCADDARDPTLRWPK